MGAILPHRLIRKLAKAWPGRRGRKSARVGRFCRAFAFGDLVRGWM